MGKYHKVRYVQETTLMDLSLELQSWMSKGWQPIGGPLRVHENGGGYAILVTKADV